MIYFMCVGYCTCMYMYMMYMCVCIYMYHTYDSYMYVTMYTHVKVQMSQMYTILESFNESLITNRVRTCTKCSSQLCFPPHL